MERTTAEPKSRKEARTYIFGVVIEEDPFDDGRMAYHAYCPSLRGASTWGYTEAEAFENISEDNIEFDPLFQIIFLDSINSAKNILKY